MSENLKINLDAAVALEMPQEPAEPLRPRGYTSSDGRRGWVLQIPDQRPIATPAYDDDLLFVGGGYGSYSSYAFHAESGALAWQIPTSDDGPTAAVVEDGLVAFNTECCSIIVCEVKTGRLVWEEWLGDPLMSQPAITRGRLLIAYPARHHNPLLRPGMGLEEKKKAIAEAKQCYGGGHFSTASFALTCEPVSTSGSRRSPATSFRRLSSPMGTFT